MAEFWDILDIKGNTTGRIHERGKLMNEGEYHLTVTILIENDSGEYLISRRTPNKLPPNIWECTGGNVVAGSNSLTTALKETYEELGIVLDPQNGQMIKHQLHKCPCNHCLADIWLFRQDVDISTVIFAPDETCGVMWASRDEINKMIDEGTFTTWDLFTYIDELFEDD